MKILKSTNTGLTEVAVVNNNKDIIIGTTKCTSSITKYKGKWTLKFPRLQF